MDIKLLLVLVLGTLGTAALLATAAVARRKRTRRIAGLPVVPVALVGALVLGVATAWAASAMIATKQIEGSVSAAGENAGNSFGWQWTPVTGSLDGNDSNDYFVVDHYNGPRSTPYGSEDYSRFSSETAANLASIFGGTYLDYGPSPTTPATGGAYAFLPDNGGAWCAVQITESGAFRVRVAEAMPGGQCIIYVGLRSAEAKSVRIGEPVTSGVTGVSLTFDPSVSSGSPQRLFNAQASTLPAAIAGTVLPPTTGVLQDRYVLPFVVTIGEDFTEGGAFTVSVPLELVG